jgi:hypothetical protein
MVAARGAWAPLCAAALACACAARAHMHTQRAAGFVGPQALPPRAERAAGHRWGAPEAFSTAAERLTKQEPVLREIAIRLSEVRLAVCLLAGCLFVACAWRGVALRALLAPRQRAERCDQGGWGLRRGRGWGAGAPPCLCIDM